MESLMTTWLHRWYLASSWGRLGALDIVLLVMLCFVGGADSYDYWERGCIGRICI